MRELTLAALVAGASLLAPAASGSPEHAEPPHKPSPITEAMPEDQPDPLGMLRRITSLKPRLRLIHDLAIDEDYGRAEVDRFTTALRASVEAPVSRQLALRVVGRLEMSQFDFRGDSDFLDTGRAPDDPFDSLFRTQIRAEGGYRLTESWAIVAGADFTSAWESGSDYARGIRGAGVFGLGYIYDDRFSVVLGARLGSKLAAGGIGIGPFVQFRWRITDELELASRGLGLKLAYRPRKSLSFFVQGELRQTSYRLDDRGGEIGRGVLQSRTAPVVAGVTWKIVRHLRMRGWAGAQVHQRYTVLDHDRSRIDRVSSNDPAFTGRLELEYRF